MTTCAQCLSELSTMRMTDLRPGSQVALHVESCPNCSDVAQEIAYAERRLSTALSEARSGFTPEELSEAALTGSERWRRQYVGRWVRGLLAAAGCVTFWFFMEKVFIPRVDPEPRTVTETIRLRCISSEEAMDLATPYLRSTGAIYSRKGSPIVTVRGTPDEFARAAAVIKSIDDAAACPIPNSSSGRVEPAGPITTITSSDKPKKD